MGELNKKNESSSEKTFPEVASNKIKLLEQVLLRLKNENNNLIAKIIDIKAINDKKIKELTSNLNKVEVKGSQENIDLKPMKNQSLSDSNTLLLLIVGLILGLVVSFIFSRILRRRNNKLNIVSRSY